MIFSAEIDHLDDARVRRRAQDGYTATCRPIENALRSVQAMLTHPNSLIEQAFIRHQAFQAEAASERRAALAAHRDLPRHRLTRLRHGLGSVMIGLGARLRGEIGAERPVVTRSWNHVGIP
jgi:hypothetical protein